AITFEAVPVVTAAVAAATLLMVTRCLNVRQAARAIDRRVVCLVGSSIALSAALEATGGSMFVARTVLDALGPTAGPATVLSAFFLMIAVLTNLLSNNSTALLFTPIGVDLANHLGVDPFIFVATVIWAANCSFATPIGYQTNLLVMTPGHYRFVDFVRAGTPLVVILWIVFSFVAPWYYNLDGPR
ncbi:MAG: SLC13 family permease, partial [Alphaproteobacteria bacterium]